jgi:hypothetical protein
MNTARWIMAHQMILELERRNVRRWARFLGTDMDVAGKDEIPEVEFGDSPKVMPLAAILNPEVYKNFVENDFTSIEDAIPDDAYENQIAELEGAGLLTDIDMLGEEAEKVVKKKKLESSMIPTMTDEEWRKTSK